jgi:hypothetical protein
MKSKKINYRNLAESQWGTGGTKAYKTNRKGTYYYSCSGHGGYVVPATALTDLEIQALKPYTSPINVPTLMGPDGICYGVDYQANAQYSSGRSRRYQCARGSQWIDVPVYLFEEDCDWSILEVFTSIRITKGSSMGESERAEQAKKSF